jgi:hypothetical protein
LRIDFQFAVDAPKWNGPVGRSPVRIPFLIFVCSFMF